MHGYFRMSMARYIAVYKGYDQSVGLQQGKDYCILSLLEGDKIKITVLYQTGIDVDPLFYASEWEFLKDWQILRVWGKKK